MTADTLRYGISKWRTSMMGAAAIMVVLHHSAFFRVADYGVMTFFINLFSYGVDIFLLLSSFGLYMGFIKNSSLPRFYWRRFVRIIPTFVAVIIGSELFYRHPEHLIDLSLWKDSFSNNWYVLFILLMYALFPLLFCLQKKWLYAPLVISTIVSILLTVVLVYINKTDIHDLPMLMGQRFPIFTIGMLLADERFKFKCSRYFPIILTGLAMVIIYISVEVFSIPEILYFLYVPFTIGTIMCLISYFERLNMSHPILNSFGTLSLEVYMIHMCGAPIFLKCALDPLLKVILLFVMTYISAWPLHYMLTKLNNHIVNIFDK